MTELTNYQKKAGVRRAIDIPRVNDTLIAMLRGTGSSDLLTLKELLGACYGKPVTIEDARSVREDLVAFYGFKRDKKRIFYSPQREYIWD